MVKEIDVTIRIRVTDEQLTAANMTAVQFAQNMFLFEHGFDIPSVVLSQKELVTDPVERWNAAIVKTSVINHPTHPVCNEEDGKGLKVLSLFHFQMESRPGDDTASLVIGVKDGVWRARWWSTLPELDGNEEIWYDGPSYDELLISFRKGVARKIKEGYYPPTVGLFKDCDTSRILHEREKSHIQWVRAE